MPVLSRQCKYSVNAEIPQMFRQNFLLFRKTPFKALFLYRVNKNTFLRVSYPRLKSQASWAEQVTLFISPQA